jgi:acylphosphatase
MLKRLEAVVSGRVQGVGFREYVRHEASTRGLTGYVRNSDDGRSVEIVAEGEEQQLRSLVDAMRDGPRFARVEDIAADFSDATNGFGRFSVEF